MSSTSESCAALAEDLQLLYGARAGEVAQELEELIEKWRAKLTPHEVRGSWDQGDALLITYADSLTSPGNRPLAALNEFLDDELGDLVRAVHLLPFYPYSSDDGFSVIDYRRVRPDCGDWEDIGKLARRRRLAFDVVLNHASRDCGWVQGDLAGDPRFRDFAFEPPADWDLSQVTRPRTSPLLHEFDSAQGPRKLWTTFSHDQVDLNFRNPRVLLEMLDVILSYIDHGASVLRLDALPYLWKESGTTCIHLSGTHAALRLIRRLIGMVSPGVRLLAETNTPFAENLAYWGEKSDGAHWLYDFTVGPLMLHALAANDPGPLTAWAESIPEPSPDQALLHVTATHDGIGLRPAEGWLEEKDIDRLAAAALAKGGHVGMRSRPNGSAGPYELNLNWFDAVRLEDSTDVATDVRRYFTTQAIAMALRGVPGIYIHSLFGTPSNFDLWRATGRARSMNRGQLSLPELRARLRQPGPGRIFRAMCRLLKVRSSQAALHPSAAQEVLDFGSGWFAILRRPEQGAPLVAVTNFSTEERVLEGLSAMSSDDAPWVDVLAEEDFEGGISFKRWQTRWLVPRAGVDDARRARSASVR